MTTLREEMDRRQSAGQPFRLKETVATIVPLITELAQHHDEGQTMFVHPGCILFEKVGSTMDLVSAMSMPTHARDRFCLAPEQKQGARGNARSSVFAIGAIVYEMVTGAHVGPGMKRPLEVVPTIPPMFEVLIAKALVGDPEHRPSDLAALAQALHSCAPTASIPPPAANELHLDGDSDFEIDVSLSLIPPPGETERMQLELASRAAEGRQAAVQAQGPTSGPISSGFAGPVSGAGGTTARLAELKANLESDPRPRYVVIRGGMDHGPFNAVELLQQIATGNFRGDDALRDALMGDERAISEWEEFAPFAEQAQLGQQVVTERKALEASAAAETAQTHTKVFIGVGALVIVAAAGAGWWFKGKKAGEEELAIKAAKAQSVDAEGGFEAGKKGSKGGKGYKGGGNGGPKVTAGGSPPQIAGGMSCEGARNQYVESYEEGVPPDLTAGAYAGVLNSGGYLNSCAVPPNVAVTICAAVQNGRAVGVTVSTKPANGTMNSCLRGAVFGMSFPPHPRLDVATTTFAAQK